MSKLCARDATIRGLQRIGWKQTRETGGYRIFSRDGQDYLLLVGKSGALRKTYNATVVSKSLSITGSRLHNAIKTIGDTQWTEPFDEIDAIRMLNEIMSQ